LATLLAVAAVGVKGSPIEPGEEFGIVNYNLAGPCILYLSGSFDCKELYGEFNDTAHCFKPGPGMLYMLYK